MKTYTASRLSEGNKLFPCIITIDDNTITLKQPGLFKGKESTIPMTSIASVDIETPLVGYSNIIIETTGEGKIRAHGFTKSEVKEMKSAILSRLA